MRLASKSKCLLMVSWIIWRGLGNVVGRPSFLIPQSFESSLIHWWLLNVKITQFASYLNSIEIRSSNEFPSANAFSKILHTNCLTNSLLKHENWRIKNVTINSNLLIISTYGVSWQVPHFFRMNQGSLLLSMDSA